ncbi:hypothetical protein ASD99_29450 [Mesorhizobium sp. Root695]|uniref:cadherin-like domain-containing protein n=1 Tax=Mesorhizobium sp. Root695 TaxID=1736589 RepID=UPI00070BEDC6|nr:cadherin-like domain-containing protein [Mesorhizobium sp. Root695]KRB24078.1 hypothetical protein ASD99_29450 [Mesorhizobium sp. Root695]
MDDRLALGLPNHEELDAPKNRFALRESRSRVNSISAVPFLIGAFAGLLKKMFETEQKVSDKHPGEPSDHNSKEDKHASDIKDDPVMTQIQKIGEVADFLRSLAEPISVNVPDLNFDVWQPHRPWGVQGLHSAHRSGVGNSIHGAGGRGGAPPPVAGNDNGGRSLPPGGSLPGQGEGDNSHGGSGSGGQGGGSGGQGNQPGQSDPGQGSPGSTKTNRRPVLTGPVFLSDGMMNLSVIITMGELLNGASDPDGDNLIVRSLEADHGELQRIGLERWLYTPEQDQTGPVTFHYQISDGADTIQQSAHLEVTEPAGESIAGTEGDDILIGTPYGDLIDARGGNDVVYGRESNDTIHGGDGDDRLIGGDGNDVIWGGRGHDILFGGRGDDTLFGGEGNDTLYGDAGNDLLLGDEGNDQIHGGDGNDVADGGSGNDTLYGEDGNDTLDAGDGNDALDGGAGTDLLIGGSGDDAMAGRDGNDHLLGGDGADDLHGDAGTDTLDGGDGNDALDGGAGTDQLIGGSGDDAMAGGDGNDQLLAGDGADELHGGAGADTLDGGNGNDMLDGGQGDDTLLGDAGDDTMSGGGGNDHLSDGLGLDHVDGGSDDDVIHLNNDLQIDIVDGGEGQDTLDLSANAADAIVDLQDGLVFLDGIEEAHVFAIESIVGSHGRNTLVANDSVNVMVGGGGNDIFVFRSLESLANHGGPFDLIMDFQTGDRIDLSRISDDNNDFASQKLFFAGAASAAPAELGAVTFNYQMLDIDHEVTVVSGNLDSDPDDEFSLVLDGHHELTAQDFILEAKHDAVLPSPALATA